jgi:hypothetical protein
LLVVDDADDLDLPAASAADAADADDDAAAAAALRAAICAKLILPLSAAAAEAALLPHAPLAEDDDDAAANDESDDDVDVAADLSLRPLRSPFLEALPFPPPFPWLLLLLFEFDAVCVFATLGVDAAR